MAAPTLPEPPAQLKAIQAFMKMAQDVERVDPIVSYWVRLFSTETALKIDKDSPECKSFLTSLILYLEKFKSSHKDNETVSNQTVGQAHYENFAMALFNKADTLDRAGTANKNTVRMFFMAAVLFEAMAVFGTLTDEISQKAKYAKFKAAYIAKCLKTGQTPKPGPVDGADLEGNTENGLPGVPKPDSINPPAGDGNNIASNVEQGGSGGILDIPEVPSDVDKNPPAKPQDPFILSPSVPPSSFVPKMPPSLPTDTGYSTNVPVVPRPHHPTPAASFTSTSTVDTGIKASNGVPLTPEGVALSQKYCKFANSALMYDDIPTAVLNLQKALKLLTTGEKPE